MLVCLLQRAARFIDWLKNLCDLTTKSSHKSSGHQRIQDNLIARVCSSTTLFAKLITSKKGRFHRHPFQVSNLHRLISALSIFSIKMISYAMLLRPLYISCWENVHVAEKMNNCRWRAEDSLSVSCTWTNTIQDKDSDWGFHSQQPKRNCRMCETSHNTSHKLCLAEGIPRPLGIHGGYWCLNTFRKIISLWDPREMPSMVLWYTEMAAK